jgi:hypothetical protein
MKHAVIEFVVAALLVQTSVAADSKNASDLTWRSYGLPVSDSESRKTIDGFAVQVLFSSDEKIFKEWKKPRAPEITVVKSIGSNEIAFPLILYANPPIDRNGMVDLTFNLSVVRPDGTIYFESRDIPLRKGPFTAPPYNLQLSETKVHFRPEPNALRGEYIFRFLIRDHIRGTDIPLTARLTVKE